MSAGAAPVCGFVELVGRIDRLLAGRDRVLAAVSGFGGAGKTTLARRLRDHYGLREEQVLHLDSFIFDRGRGDGPLDGFDWPRFAALLDAARDGRRLEYEANDFDGRPSGRRVDAAPAALTIAEGVRLIRPPLADRFDLTVWIDCPPEVATERGLARDRAAGAPPEDLALWATDWAPADRSHFERDRPDLRADLLYRA